LSTRAQALMLQFVMMLQFVTNAVFQSSARALSTRAPGVHRRSFRQRNVSILARALSTRAHFSGRADYLLVCFNPRPRFINAGAQASRPLARLIKVSILARALSTRARSSL